MVSRGSIYVSMVRFAEVTMAYLWRHEGNQTSRSMPPPYRYLGFGLKIASEIEFPELFPGGSGEADLWIRHGMPEDTSFDDHDAHKVWHELLPDRFRLNIPGTGRYLAHSGDTVCFMESPVAELSTARVYVLTVTMAALLMQKGRFLLHASGVVRDGRIHLFMGESGTGKSSLLAELRKRGYVPFTDDVCALTIDAEGEGPVRAHASYPMMKLLPESMRAIEDPRYGFEHRIWPDEEKYGQFFHEEFTTEALPIGSIQILKVESGLTGGYSSEKVTGVSGFRLLTEHTYRKQFIREIGLATAHAGLLSRLLSDITVRTLSRPTAGSDIRTFADFAEALIGDP
jgi:hypothetical protein